MWPWASWDLCLPQGDYVIADSVYTGICPSFALFSSSSFFLFLLQGAGAIHFQDFNAEVLKCLTLPNVNANLPAETSVSDRCEIRYFAGDWGEVDRILPHAHLDSMDDAPSGSDPTTGYDVTLMAETVYSISTLQSLYSLIKKVWQWAFCFAFVSVGTTVFLTTNHSMYLYNSVLAVLMVLSICLQRSIILE